MPQFTQLTRDPTLADRVSESILKRIISGEFKPGDKLPSERELGEQFGVSRTVVREAVRALTGRGLISVRAGSGLRVAEADPAAVAESLALLVRSHAGFAYHHVHEVRVMLEVQMAGVAAERAEPADLEQVRKAVAAMERARSVEQKATRDLEFHRAIAQATHNLLYLILHDAIGDALIEVRRTNLTLGGQDEATESHRRILDCISAHDVEGARRAMQHHLEAVEEIWNATREDGQETRP